MISRIWHGWTTHGNADAYEAIVTGQVIPDILAREIPGFKKIELFRRPLADEVEFITVMWFSSIEAVKAFVGEDHEVSHVPPAARAVLSRFDDRSQHYDILLSRTGPNDRA